MEKMKIKSEVKSKVPILMKNFIFFYSLGTLKNEK